MGSRIFVRGLPPSMTDDDFRSHFAKRYTVTDAKLFPQRRIGYVGFKTPEEAASAVKYFNKSFIRMSKIFVELAHSIPANPRTTHPTAKEDHPASVGAQSIPAANDNPLKRKRNVDEKINENSKLKEFLGVMRPQPKSQAWNEEIPRPPTTVADPMEVEGPGDALAQPSTTQDVLPNVQKPVLVHEEVERDPDTEVQVIEPQDSDRAAATGSTDPSTDADWMRSRTSRLLGLLDDDEEDAAGQTTQKPEAEEPTKSNTKNDTRLSSSLPALQNRVADASVEGHSAEITDTEIPEEGEMETSERQAIGQSGRLFLRNLAYTITEDDLRSLFDPNQKIDEIHLPLDPSSGKPKGFAFVQFEDSEQAKEAFERLDGTTLQGRLLHVVPATAKRDKKLDEFEISKLPLKKQRQIQRKAQATSSSFNWNSLYMNTNAVMTSIADRLGVAKSELLDPSSSDAGVKQAQAETHVIQETKAYFESNGVDLTAFSRRERDDRAILVKNFTYGTTPDELKKLFEEHGTVLRVLMPPSGTIAIVEFSQVPQARSAFSALAYRKFKDSVLFLEKAPKAIFTEGVKSSIPKTQNVPSGEAAKISGSDLLQEEPIEEVLDTSTLFVRNLSFATSNERFHEVFKPLDGFVSARVKTKTDPKKPGQILSMGFGFLEFRSPAQAQAALASMNGYSLDGHQLLIKASHKGQDAAEERRKEDLAKKLKGRKSKIIIKNLPFEVSKKDVRNLFKSYGQLRAVRMPKKFDNSRKGYAFAEFTTPKEAENAMDALRNTHLLGRRLVLDFAAGDAEDPEKEIEKMLQKVERQSNSIAFQQMANNERKKFNITNTEEDLAD